MRLLALDCSLRDTGAVVLQDGELASFLAIKPHATMTGIERVAWIAGNVLDFARAQHIERVVIENYAFGQVTVAYGLGELGGVIRFLLWRAQIPFDVMGPGVWKKVALGKGNLKKDELRLAIFKRYAFEHEDQNVIDAFGLAMGYWLQQTQAPKPRISNPRRRRVDREVPHVAA